MTQRIELFLLSMTQRMGPFVQIRRKELDPFSNLTENEKFVEIWLNEFFCMNPRMGIFLSTSQRIEFFWRWLMELNFIFLFLWTWLKERNPFSSDWKNWTLIMTLRTQLFFKCDKKLFFWTLFEELNPFLLCLQKLNHFLYNKTPRIEPFFNTTQRFCLWKMTQKNQKFWIWLTELNFLNVIQRFLHKDSKHWTLLVNMTHRIEPFCSIWLKELNHRTFSQWFKEFNFLIWLEELNPFLKRPEKLTFLVKMSQIIRTLFEPWFTELNIHFEKYDSKNSTLLFNMTYRIKSLSSTWLIEIEPFFSTLLKELNPLRLNMTLRFELFSAKKWLKELNLGSKKKPQKMELFF